MYSSERHASLQNADPVLVQLGGVMTTGDLDRFRAVAGTALALELDEAYLDTQPILVRVTPEEELAEPLRTVVTDAATGAEVARKPLLKRPDGPHEAELAPLPAGTYRVSIGGDPAAEPVHDLFCVLPEDPGS